MRGVDLDKKTSLKGGRDGVQEVFKEAIAKPIPTAAIALSSMQDAMRPQVIWSLFGF